MLTAVIVTTITSDIKILITITKRTIKILIIYLDIDLIDEIYRILNRLNII